MVSYPRRSPGPLRGRGGPCGRVAATVSRDGWPGCSPPTPASAPTSGRLAGRRSRWARRGSGLAAAAVAGAGRSDGHRPSACPARENCCAAAGVGLRAAAHPVVAVRLHPAVHDRYRTARGAGRPPRDALVAAASQHRAVDSSAGPAGSGAAPRGHQPPTGRPPLLATLGRDLRELQRCLPPRWPPIRSYPAPATPTPCWAGCNPTSLPIPLVRRTFRCDVVRCEPTTARSRCTAVMDRPGRSTCCARFYWVCSSTTRPSSRATFWSCVPISRPTRR